MSAKLGQHFLADTAALIKMVGALAPQQDETIVEIGPGHGELTRKIKNKDERIKIIAIEKDSRLVTLLKKKFKDNERVEIIEGDALKVLPEITTSYNPQATSYKVVGNVPYYITGKLLRTIGGLMAKPTRCVLTLQKEVALRMAARPPRMNRLAASVQFWAEPRIVASVPRTAFRPAPDVDSAVVSLEVRTTDLGMRDDDYYEMVRVLFQQPRKTILNNLTVLLDREKAAEALRATGVDERARPQDLTIENIVQIAGCLKRGRVEWG